MNLITAIKTGLSLFFMNDEVSNAREALVNAERKHGQDHPEVVLRLIELVIALNKEEKDPEADTLATRALAIMEEMNKADHPEVDNLLAGIPSLFRSEPDCAMLESFYQRLLSVREAKGDPCRLAELLSHIADFHDRCHDYAKAEQLYLRSLAVRESGCGPEAVAWGLQDLAYHYEQHEDFAKAELFYTRAIAAWEEQGDKEALVAILDDLAECYESQNKCADAESTYERAISICVEQEDAPCFIYRMIGLGELYKKQGRYSDAEQSYLEAIDVWVDERTYIKADAVTGLGSVYSEQGDHAKAMSLYEDYLPHVEKQYGRNSHILANFLGAFSKIYRDAGQDKKAIALDKRQKRITGSL